MTTVQYGAVGHVPIPSTTLTSTNSSEGIYIISLEQRNLFSLINDVFLCGAIGLFGIISNIINLVVFYKQGLDTTINISFFALAVSDLSCLIFQTWYIICVIPYFEQLRLPMVYSDVQFLIGTIPRQIFASVTCLITAYVTAERCLCIAFPLRVKQMITPRKTTLIIIGIFLVTSSNGFTLFAVGYLDWQFYPELNQTLLGAVVTKHKVIVQGVVFIIHALFELVSLIGVVVFTSILIRKLGQTSAWRQSVKGNQEKADPTSKRDRATMRMVVLIAVILIVTNIPVVALGVTTFCEPEFITGGKYFTIYYISWSFAFLFETINSSVNIFLYYRMSSKFRHIFIEMFQVCGRITER